jgi:hypothetical protein
LAGSLHAGICAFATGTPFAFSLRDSQEDPFKYYDFASFYKINIVFHEDFDSAIKWYASEESFRVDLIPVDFEVYPKSLLKYLKINLVELRSKIEVHANSRNRVHGLKLKSLENYINVNN